MTALRNDLGAQAEEQCPHRARRELLREAHMRQRIRDAVKKGHQRIAVVCGAWHLGGLQAKVKVSHIPYKGSAPSVVSLVSGETDFGFLTAVTISAQLNAGKVKALAVAHTERLPAMPNVPTMSEAGLKGFTADAWFLAAVPAGTPKPIVDRLYAEIAKALPAPDVKAKLDGMGVLASGLLCQG